MYALGDVKTMYRVHIALTDGYNSRAAASLFLVICSAGLCGQVVCVHVQKACGCADYAVSQDDVAYFQRCEQMGIFHFKHNKCPFYNSIYVSILTSNGQAGNRKMQNKKLPEKYSGSFA